MSYQKFKEVSYKIEQFALGSFLGAIIFIVGVCIVLCSLIFGLSWIFSDKTDRGQCLQSHTESYVTYMYVNKTMMPMTNYRNVCDMWEYAEGRG